ncbi:allantoate amidohydrolase [Trichothermofontia sp.]
MAQILDGLRINAERLAQSVEQLAAIGQLPGGGVRRIAYTPEDLQARAQVQAWMAAAGMDVRTDAAGNLIGTYPGTNPDLPLLMTGSHIDTVPTGGRYDGAFGVLAALEAVRTLAEQPLRLRHSLAVVVFTDEEGSMIGSKAIAGSVVPDPAYYRRSDGEDIRTCLQRIGGNWDEIAQAYLPPGRIAAFVELHVEQGPVLESQGQQIGIVEGIVGQRRYQIQITGRANHAGTTPMDLRQDALVAAAQVVLAVQAIGQTPGQQVATVGMLHVFPNAANVIPGQVDLSVDLRDLANAHLDQLVAQLEQQLTTIAVQTQTQIHLTPCLKNDPALAHPAIQRAIAQSCEALTLSYTYLPSRASHDAQEIARIAPMGMIFVPSVAGLSHAEAEYTTPEQCTAGANVLLQTLLRLDQLTINDREVCRNDFSRPTVR